MSARSRRVVVTQRFFDDETRAWLEGQGCEVIIADLPPGKGDGDFTPDELKALLAGAGGWIVGHARVTRDLLAALPMLEVIDSQDVVVAQLKAFQPSTFPHLTEQAGGARHAVPSSQPVALFVRD